MMQKKTFLVTKSCVVALVTRKLFSIDDVCGKPVFSDEANMSDAMAVFLMGSEYFDGYKTLSNMSLHVYFDAKRVFCKFRNSVVVFLRYMSLFV